MKNDFLKKFTIFCISVIISLTSIEILLRYFIIKPWNNIATNDPKIFKNHPRFGWKAKKGSYTFLSPDNTHEKFVINLNENGDRENGNNKNNSLNEILIIGGSFTQGWGVNDNETFSYKLQKKYNDFKIYNFGQGGYGSVQSFLLLEEQIKKIKSPKLVIYGIIQHHEYRNIAHVSWLRMLSQYSSRGHILTPYGSVGIDNQLTFNQPIGYTKFPYREMSSIITLIEKVYNKLNGRKRVYIEKTKKKKQQLIVTKKIILKMKEISEKFGSKFILVNLDWQGSFKEENYEIFLKTNGIRFLNCSVPINEKFFIQNDYHPNKNAHTYYKECLVGYIEKEGLLKF